MKGAPIKLNKAVTVEVCRSLEAGCTVASAVANADISHSTYSNWRRKGEADAEARLESGETTPTPYEVFYRATEKALAAREESWVNDIKAADDWKAKAWLLERTNPQKWGRRTADINIGIQQEFQHHPLVAAVSGDPKLRKEIVNVSHAIANAMATSHSHASSDGNHVIGGEVEASQAPRIHRSPSDRDDSQ